LVLAEARVCPVALKSKKQRMKKKERKKQRKKVKNR
jgi:hypothetical protein